MRRFLIWWLALWIASGALWLLLTDTHQFQQLIAGGVTATVAATAGAAAATLALPPTRIPLRSLLAAWRIPWAIARDCGVLALVLVKALARRDVAGSFRVVRFEDGDDHALHGGRVALAETFGSLAPNTYVVGVDRERGVMLLHQLRPTDDPGGDADPLDVR